MKKEVIFVCMMLLCISIGYILGLTNNMNTNDFINTPEDEYFHTSLYKGYKMLTIPAYIEDGGQYEYLLVDNFLTFDEQGCQDITRPYGFLTVNTTTNMIEFIKTRGYTIDADTNITFSNITIELRGREIP